MKHKNFMLLFLCLVLFSVVHAQTFGYNSENGLGTTPLRENITLLQTCSNATFINITSIVYPNQTLHILNQTMTNQGGGLFTLTFPSNNVLGNYKVIGTSNGCEIDFNYVYETTLYGNSPSVWAFILIMIFGWLALVGLILFNLHFNKQKREQIYNKMVNGFFNYETGLKKQNLGELVLIAFFYGLSSVMFAWYYLIVLFNVWVFYNFVDSFGITFLSYLSLVTLNIVLWGTILMLMVLFFYLFKLSINLLDDVTKTLNGLGSGGK